MAREHEVGIEVSVYQVGKKVYHLPFLQINIVINVLCVYDITGACTHRIFRNRFSDDNGC